MEFLRFGSSIPGGYWGCCAMCIIQNFKFDPDAKASIQIVSGDGGEAIGDNFAGLTYKEIFETRLRIGTFSTSDMPNHGFLAILTDWQVGSNLGKKWLKILRENGFEFIRTVDNSVYSGATLAPVNNTGDSDHKNYLFGLFRNIGNGQVQDPFEPPQAWKDLTKDGPKQANDYITQIQRNAITKSQNKFNRKAWGRLGSPTFYTEEEVKAAGVTVTFAGQRSRLPQQNAKQREAVLLKLQKVTSPAPFKSETPDKAVAAPMPCYDDDVSI